MPVSAPLSADAWLQQLFRSQAAAKGGVIRRQKRDIERLLGWDRFRRELKRRGFHAVENAGQVVIFCNQDAVRIIQ
ncbi:N-(5'-phosphoribosyl)anthranilate isomerase [Leisingera caerulea]|uniref:N-(5'-phosphoribosyl)anthranilate isomerase n=1 Tax=Leisingera caerulea TaxID=506591 RepID=UPI0021A3AAFE|nr:N-(5'-phosphoribosyl)anthranilate isomerase [Leisingera caerulea]UWQ61170.1 N-(5'-phosphoribosyl)anthranilate isomerase [Leisingera caerulea]